MTCSNELLNPHPARSGWGFQRIRAGAFRFLLPLAAATSLIGGAIPVGGLQTAWSADAPAPASCAIIDNDFDVDDMMAVPMVTGSRHVAAIIETEGVSQPQRSAPVIDALVNGGMPAHDERAIPIIVGADQGGARDLSDFQSWLPFFRGVMLRGNGFLPAPPKPWPQQPNFERNISSLVEGCDTVSVLLLGPYSSFVRYYPLIKEKIDRIVIMGKMIGDDSAGKGNMSFNCEYDLPACETAMAMLKGQPVFFVDLPRLPGCRKKGTLPEPHCHTPNLAMVAGDASTDGLVEEALPGRLRKALLNEFDCSTLVAAGEPPKAACSSKSTWEPVDHAAFGGSGVLLWDQTAALFLLKPDAFALYYPPDNPAIGGKHYEPIVIEGSHEKTIAHLRALWTEFTNRAARIP